MKTTMTPANNYANITGGFYLHHLSPHLKNNMPSGGSGGFEDGHVEWHKFGPLTVMSPRTLSGTVFWW